MVAMGQPKVQSFGNLIVAALLVIVVGFSTPSFAQQLYDSHGPYVCSDSAQPCGAFALYRAQHNYTDFKSIGRLFQSDPEKLAAQNGVKNTTKLQIGTPLIIPLNCICSDSGKSFANLTRVIQANDTYFSLSTVDFESLSSIDDIAYVNPTVNYFDLKPNQTIMLPVRCACPSKDQISRNVTSLVTYPVGILETTAEIAASFGVTNESLLNANSLAGANPLIYNDTTLLVPINTTSPHYSQVAMIASAPTGSSPSKSPPGSSPSGGSSSHTGAKVAIAVGVSAGVVILILAAVCMCWTLMMRREWQRGDDSEAPLYPGKVCRRASPSPTPPFKNKMKKAPSLDALANMSHMMGSERPIVFTYEEVRDATNDFSEGSVLQGSVYRGTLKGRVVAIKQMKGNVSQELQILCRVHHSNLISFVGLCAKEADLLYLVYEYADNGSLSECLHTDLLSVDKLSTKSSSFLGWTMRVRIALDVASGLEYIHDYVSPSYVHKDVKSSNILLDRAFRAKIANFAMAKSGGGNADMVTQNKVGTYGYMAPEYVSHGLVTPKADVFSFGVVLLELLSGREAVSEGTGEGEERCLYSAITPLLESTDPVTNIKLWMDPVLNNNYPTETAMNMAMLAKSCVQADPLHRPHMKNVTCALSNCLTATLEWETSSVFAATLASTPIPAR